MTTYPIRRATKADYDAICVLLAEENEMYIVAKPRFFRPWPGKMITVQELVETLEDNTQAVYVVDDPERRGKALLGVMHLRLLQTSRSLPPSFRFRQFVYVDTILVTKSHWSKGIGQALMAQADAWAAELNVGEIELNVWEFNERAIHFYELLGYKTISRRMWRERG